jgi:hypothetical protein
VRLVDRRTNAEIATERFLSQKSVETRVALARAVERAG